VDFEIARVPWVKQRYAEISKIVYVARDHGQAMLGGGRRNESIADV
jgi:hypothetical protein